MSWLVLLGTEFFSSLQETEVLPLLARQERKMGSPEPMVLLGHPELKSAFWKNGLGFPSTLNPPLLLSLPALPHGEIHKPLPPCTYLHNWNLSQRARRITLASSVFP